MHTENINPATSTATEGSSLSGKAFRFLIGGGPAFAIALPLNWFLVARLHLAAPLAYALVLCFQLIANFFICRSFVFRSKNPAGEQFVKFALGFGLFRVADWALFSFAVNTLGVFYLYAQLCNVAIFMVIKFFYARLIMEPRVAPSGEYQPAISQGPSAFPGSQSSDSHPGAR